MASLDTIPSIYWIQLAWLDPLISFGTMLQALFAPDMLFAIYLPRHLVAAVPFPPLYRPLLHQVGAWYLFHTIVSGATPRVTRDRNVWKMLQVAMLAIDSCLLWDFYGIVAEQGRADPRAWKMGELAGVAYVACVWVLRLSFVVGVGLSRRTVTSDGGVKKQA
ncbi:hypothetical protein GGTG_03590 [Gaeumannomyces tritici R3-111a-1]|uniref:DUF7704 domain-containing protein n=1 Tax=Gaeumannomyces tritici (strain R3-111a-1) TaxID=644352 RepID=J3NQN4_GAET3|nr:hypothetical protein GGTG_03590 [Gaeumannomyces tritici R3-111a-1]EJT78490.1 hypothetical protein GGTG_03590 [Gaeumannomyces tritici R3-111a-1]